MQASEHARIILAWLTVSDQEFAEGRRCRHPRSYGELPRMLYWRSLWNAVGGMAVIGDFVVAVRRFAEEHDDKILQEWFRTARRFHANFYQNDL